MPDTLYMQNVLTKRKIIHLRKVILIYNILYISRVHFAFAEIKHVPLYVIVFIVCKGLYVM